MLVATHQDESGRLYASRLVQSIYHRRGQQALTENEQDACQERRKTWDFQSTSNRIWGRWHDHLYPDIAVEGV